MTKDSPDSPIKPVGRRAIANTFANPFVVSIARAYVNSYVHPYAYARARASSPNFYAEAIDSCVELANLCTQDRIFPRVNITGLITDLQAVNNVISNTYSGEKRQKFIDKLRQNWKKTCALTPELLNLYPSIGLLKDEDGTLREIYDHYFYINRLILDCKEVGVNVSPTVWQEIENRMLRVP
jgi:hypothetical protein